MAFEDNYYLKANKETPATKLRSPGILVYIDIKLMQIFVGVCCIGSEKRVYVRTAWRLQPTPGTVNSACCRF